MAQTAEHILAVDPHDALDSLDTMRANVHALGGGRITIAIGHAEVLMPSLYIAGARFGLIFVDGDHSETAVARDVVWAERLLDQDGTLACHDYGEDTCTSVRPVLDRIGEPDLLVDTLWIRESRS
jgi:hypothetical protein